MIRINVQIPNFVLTLDGCRMSVADNMREILREVPPGVSVVAVSKTQPAEAIMEAYHAGHRIFGENRAQELAAKHAILPYDIQWHFIGHLQGNKVRMIAPFVTLIHSIDSLRLLGEVDREASRAGRVIDCLLQFHIATEETKFGLDLSEAKALLSSHERKNMEHIRITGVMGMATFTEDEKLVRGEFRNLREIFEYLKKNYFADEPLFREISMGMSGDYGIAIEEGSTIIRIGTIIFGMRH